LGKEVSEAGKSKEFKNKSWGTWALARREK
jgi:hypothetical protein